MKNIFLHISKQSFPFLSLFALINEKKKRIQKKRVAASLTSFQSLADTKSNRHLDTRKREREREREELYIVWEAGSRVKGEAINRLTSLRATSALYSAVRTGPRIY